jgi:hypothetical protein
MTFRFDRFLIVRLACIFVLASARRRRPIRILGRRDRAHRQPRPLAHAIEADTGNRVSGNPAAIHLGYRLFFEPRLAANRQISCATCHHRGSGFQDGLATASGLQFGVRNTPGLWNVGQQRWFGWDGGHDNLWSASLRPILDPAEMGGDTKRTARLLRSQAELDCLYQQAFGKAPDPRDDPEPPGERSQGDRAWQETLVSPPRPSMPCATRSCAATTQPSHDMRPQYDAGYACSSDAGNAPPATPVRCSAMANSATSACPSSSNQRVSTPDARAASSACWPPPTTCSAATTTMRPGKTPRQRATCDPSTATSVNSRCPACAT